MYGNQNQMPSLMTSLLIEVIESLDEFFSHSC
jgi:hypothetical protein